MKDKKKPSKFFRVFNFKLFFLDSARFVYMLIYPFLRVKKFGLDKKRYKNKFKGAMILACNHSSFTDAPFIGAAFFYRRTYFLAAKEVMDTRLKNLLLKGAGCIKIDRENTDIKAIRECVDVLKNGHLLCLFPQGMIEKNDSLNQVKSGAVLIASNAKVPILPIYSEKRKNIFKSRKMVIGTPINISDYFSKRIPSIDDINLATNALLRSLEECKKVFDKLD